MKKIGFWLFLCVAYVNAITPFGLLYLKSDLYAFLLYHVLRYRRKVVRDNLVRAFPEKSLKEIKKTEKQFYHNLVDLAAEMCKMLTLKPEQLSQRVTFTNPEMVEELRQKGKGVFLSLPHSGNWEWLWKLQGTVSNHKPYAIYKKMENPFFDQFVFNLRTSHVEDKTTLVETRSVRSVLERWRGTPSSVLLLGDQSPRGVATDYWTEFLHRDTCWYTGLEVLARDLDYAVVYVEMDRVKRGHYEVTFKMICETPENHPQGAILEQYVRHLERFIDRHPDNWLWSHRRWKHSRQPQNA